MKTKNENSPETQHSTAAANQNGETAARMVEQLSPFTEQIRLRGALATNAETVSVVQDLVHARHMSPSDRIRTKADAMQFLEGKMAAEVLVARARERRLDGEELQESRMQHYATGLTVGEA
jgi:uncharacterized protein YdbL (DUF1318 family)